MTVKVLVERRVRVGYEETVWHMVREMRAEAVRTRGYLYGETWRLVSNPRTLMVISVWSSLEHWHQWAQDDYHQKMDERINRMLLRPSVARVFEDATDPVPGPPNRRGTQDHYNDTLSVAGGRGGVTPPPLPGTEAPALK